LLGVLPSTNFNGITQLIPDYLVSGRKLPLFETTRIIEWL
jgi:hypothetical protein